MRKYILMIITFSLASFAGITSAEETDILGIWVNQAGDGQIEISLHQEKYIGIIIGGSNDQDRKDINNPDLALRDRSLLGMKIVGDLTYRDNDRWAGGWICDPNNGKTYKCKARLIDANTLEIRGYVGISMFGRTETWQKESASN
jgi:uncharacterized protein (DUF2147 family)